MGLKKLLGLISLICLLPLSCNPEENEILIDFAIFNESGTAINIISYPTINFRNPRDIISIEDDGAYSQRVDTKVERSSSFTYGALFRTDTISIIFGGERKINYSCATSTSTNNCSNPRNILKIGVESETNSDAERVDYTFTLADFENATPCEGPCR